MPRTTPSRPPRTDQSARVLRALLRRIDELQDAFLPARPLELLEARRADLDATTITNTFATELIHVELGDEMIRALRVVNSADQPIEIAYDGANVAEEILAGETLWVPFLAFGVRLYKSVTVQAPVTPTAGRVKATGYITDV